MCDYSLHHVKSRPAKVGDKLTTRNFGTGTRGFAAQGPPARSARPRRPRRRTDLMSRAGLEPAATRLKGACSTTELPTLTFRLNQVFAAGATA